MKPEDGIKKRIAERNGIRHDKKREESEGTQQFILWTEEQSWKEAVNIIATRGVIGTIEI